jgi:hypothetical protein
METQGKNVHRVTPYLVAESKLSRRAFQEVLNRNRHLDLSGLLTYVGLLIAAYSVLPEYRKLSIRVFVGYRYSDLLYSCLLQSWRLSPC